MEGEHLVLALTGILVGVMRAGFGGGVGVVAGPMLALMMPAKMALGVILPLTLTADAISGRYYWGYWVGRHLLVLLPGMLVGVAVGAILLDLIPEAGFRRMLGGLAILFALLQVYRDRLPRSQHPPGRWMNLGVGIALGLVSTLLHSGGMVLMLYLLPQGLSGRAFVATIWLLGVSVNLIKLWPYLTLGLIGRETLMLDMGILPAVAVGALLGILLNRRLSVVWFNRAILALVLAIGIKLMAT